MPTHRIPAPEDAIRFKNLIGVVEDALAAQHVVGREARAFLEPARNLLKNQNWTETPADGLAVFWARDFFRYYSAGTPFAELALVYGRLHLTPLVSSLPMPGDFFVLAISSNRVRLLRMSSAAATEVKVDSLPSNLPNALPLEEPEPMIQAHGGVRHGLAGRSTVFHGQGGAPDHAKENLLLFFRQVDAALHSVLHDQKLPLVFAGVNYLFPLYRAVNTYAHLVDEHVSGNPDQASPRRLHDDAQAVLWIRLDQPRREALTRCLDHRLTRLRSDDLPSILSAAHDGRIETLFVAANPIQWGTFDPMTKKVQLCAEQEPETEDLVSRAVVETLRNRGKVYPAKKGELPGRKPLVALLRYE
jgi:hypothetical protein